MPSDLRNLAQIEQDADAVFFRYRDHYYLSREKVPKGYEIDHEAALNKCKDAMEIIIAKQRLGPNGTARTGVDIKTNRFWNLNEQKELIADF